MRVGDALPQLTDRVPLRALRQIAARTDRTDRAKLRPMRTRFFASLGAAALAANATVACGRPVSQLPLSRTDRVTMAVADRLNQTPTLAADGDRVALAWAAALPDATADVYVAMSEDGGRTFGPPTRANELPGDVRAAEQQAPRIALRGNHLAVLWTAKRGGLTALRLAESHDGGRSFAPSRPIAPEGAPGTRGWGSVTIDAADLTQVVWLDTRVAAEAKAAADHTVSAGTSSHGAADHAAMGHGSASVATPRGGGPSPAAAPMNHGGGMAMPATRQDVYAATIAADGGVSTRLLAAGVCFCCKTALAGSGETLSAAWRDIYGDNWRDISFARIGRLATASSGEVERVRVAQDGWQLAGCPEDGPAMAVDADGAAHLVWPTLVHDNPSVKGVFYSSTTDGQHFPARLRLDTGDRSASHPAVALTKAGDVVAVWEETALTTHHVMLRRLAGGRWTTPVSLNGEERGESPVVAPTRSGVVIAWGAKAGDRRVIRVSRLD